ncbi:MAG: hypothetical protein L3J89_12500 [Gammaproteobacteria bacterium]|nr:hypothetical protein [Gammaproteobacteria bacterium]
MKIAPLLKILIFLLMTLSIVNCGGGGSEAPANNNTGDNPLITGSISGIIQDADTQQPVEGAIVSVNGSSVATSVFGIYNLENISANDRIVVTIQRTEYAEQSKIVSLNKQNQVINLNVSILPVDSIEEFDPDLAQALTVTDSPAVVILTASSLVQADGTTSPSGMVISNLTVIDPTIDIDLMPGDMQTGTDDGTLAQIESFGAITVTFVDAAGNDLNLAGGSPATIRIPVASNSDNPPATIPLYFYDTETGLWIEEGTATLDPTEGFYEGSVTHFSTWNADLIFERVTINGCVEDTNGRRLENIFIRSKGQDYSGTSVARTDNAGNFSIFVKSDARVSIFGRAFSRSTNTVDVQTGTSDITLDSCLVLQDAVILIPGPGNTTGGGILTLSGADTGAVGTTLEFLDAANLFSSVGGVVILATEGEDVLVGPTDPDNYFLLSSIGDAFFNLRITVEAQEYRYLCGTGGTYPDVGVGCGVGTITFNIVDNSMTFTNTIFRRLPDGSDAIIDLVVNGTIQWRNIDVSELP